MKNNKSLYIIVGILIISLITLSIAFAALSTNLNINFGNVNQSAQTWNVAFTGSSVAGTASGSASTAGRSCGTATVTATQVNVGDTQLSKPDDKCQWVLTVKNNGSISAKLSTITANKGNNTCNIGGTTGSQTSMVCGNITYTLTSDGTTALPINTSLAANATQTVYVTAKYTGTGVNTTAVTQSGLSFVLGYTQN